MIESSNTKRSFLPENLSFDSWENLKPYFEELKSRTISSVIELEQWMKDRSELDAVLEEEMGWRYIRMNIDTRDEEKQKAFEFFVQEISPKVAPYQNDFNEKLIESPFMEQLDKEKYKVMLRGIKKQIEIYRDKNIPLFTQLEQDSQKFGMLSAKMVIRYKGKDYTLQQATKLLKSTDRQVRQDIYELIADRRLQDVDELNSLYSHLIALRDKVAKNADFENYRDYMFAAMGRFDYTAEDCEKFQDSVASEVVPVNNLLDAQRKQSLQLEKLKPWDLSVDPDGKEPLKPFNNGKELLEKAIDCFNRIDPFFAECLQKMDKMGYLDLESKEGKAPGGFNYPLYESGVPFIYMNAVGLFRDVITMLHEGGHAIHSFLSDNLELLDFKNFPSEVAELASMSMELLSMDHWDVFFDNEEDLKRAKRDQLIGVLGTLPWVAAIDKFQHWVYTHVDHTVEERYKRWSELMDEFGSSVTNWEGQEMVRKNSWQRQLHLYEVPFYYIEYGFAQLGAIALWRNYKKDPQKAIQQYKEALKLGYTKTIGEIYNTAGISFDFSTDYVKELISFVEKELAKIQN